MMKEIKRTYLKTPLGIAEIKGNSLGISSVTLTDKTESEFEITPPELFPAVKQLEEYFRGSLKNFDLKLNPEGTDFQKRVWNMLLKIPYGSTWSYLDLAKKMGDINATRAVAAANGKNPIWIIIPCHRVIGSNGTLTGYAGGLWRKKWLLEKENPPVQQQLF